MSNCLLLPDFAKTFVFAKIFDNKVQNYFPFSTKYFNFLRNSRVREVNNYANTVVIVMSPSSMTM